VYNLLEADVEEIENIVKMLKAEKLDREKTVIAISSVMVWNQTSVKLRQKKEEDEETDDEVIKEEEIFEEVQKEEGEEEEKEEQTNS